MYEELIEKLRCCVDQIRCGECRYVKDCDGDRMLMSQAADAIEELQRKLCDWCGVCPEEKRRPSDCEIIYPNTPVPEVYIEPPKEKSK